MKEKEESHREKKYNWYNKATKTITQYNDDVFELIKKGVQENQNEIYLNLYQLTRLVVKRAKWIRNNNYDLDYFCEVIAGDIMLNILNDTYHFKNFPAFIHKVMPQYYAELFTYRYREVDFSDCAPEVIEHFLDGEQIGHAVAFDLERIDNKLYLENFNKIVDTVFLSSCKYYPGTKEYNNLKVSLGLSLVRGYTVGYHISFLDLDHLELLIKAVYLQMQKDLEN